MRRLALMLLFFYTVFSHVVGQAPQKINYQAVVRHSDGSVISDTQISMKISIRIGGVNGSEVYSEVHNVMTNEYGLVRLGIGTGTSADNFSLIDWSAGKELWVRIEIDETGGSNFQLMGGMELLSVPFSLYASEAGSAPPILTSMSEEERQLLDNPPLGYIILNTTTNKVNVYKSDGWFELGDEKISESFSCGKNLIDSRDNQEYKTIKIGEQCWMAENLNVGEMIDGAVNMTDNENIEKYCYQNSSAFCDTYGGLYQWDELMSYTKLESAQGICPEGWHIPSDIEVQELEISLGMDPTAAALTNTWRGSDQGLQMAMGDLQVLKHYFLGEELLEVYILQ